jgi:hypothetical protein
LTHWSFQSVDVWFENFVRPAFPSDLIPIREGWRYELGVRYSKADGLIGIHPPLPGEDRTVGDLFNGDFEWQNEGRAGTSDHRTIIFVGFYPPSKEENHAKTKGKDKDKGKDDRTNNKGGRDGNIPDDRKRARSSSTFGSPPTIRTKRRIELHPYYQANLPSHHAIEPIPEASQYDDWMSDISLPSVDTLLGIPSYNRTISKALSFLT